VPQIESSIYQPDCAAAMNCRTMLFITALVSVQGKLIPASDQAELMRQAGGGAGVDHGHDKGAACGLMTGCADIKCVAPFVLKRAKGQCCPTCFADEASVALDRHTSMKGPSPYKAPLAAAAPSSCRGVKCFQPVCIAGYTPGQMPGACCNSCKPALLAANKTVHKLIPAADQSELMRQASGGAGVDHGHDKGAACGLMTGCADIKCVPPFQLSRQPGQCCPTCHADDAAVALDRHSAMNGPSPYAAKIAAAAPSSCKGVKCFQPVCIAGYEPGQMPGACCNSCKPSR